MRCWHERSLGVLILCIAGLLTSSASGEERRASRGLGLDVVLLLDSSPSTKTTDPQNHRLTAAHFLLDYLDATAELLRVNHWAAFANFGGRVGAAVPLQLVGGGRVHEKLQAETIPYTDFRPALEFALRELRPVSPVTGRPAIVVLFTDGLPELASGGLEGRALDQYFAGEPFAGDAVGLQVSRQVAELGELGGELFVVAVGSNQQAEAGWKSLIPASHYLPLESTSQLAGAYHRIFSERLGFAGVKQHDVEAGKPVAIRMEPLVEQVIFSFIKEGVEADLDLTDPHGQHPQRVSGGKDGDLHEVFETTRPDSGTVWTAEVTGGSARLFVAQRRPPLEVAEPFTPQPAGLPLSLIASMGEGAESPDGLRITATIEGPGFEEPLEQELDALENERFRLVTPPAGARGTYHVQLQAHFDGKNLATIVRDLEIEVEPVPEIASVEVVEDEDEWRVEVLVRNADQLEPGSVPWVRLAEGSKDETPHLDLGSKVVRGVSNLGDVTFVATPSEREFGKPMIESVVSGVTPAGLRYFSRTITAIVADKGHWLAWMYVVLGLLIAAVLVIHPSVREALTPGPYPLPNGERRRIARARRLRFVPPQLIDNALKPIRLAGCNGRGLGLYHPQLKNYATDLGALADCLGNHERADLLATKLRYDDNPVRRAAREKVVEALENRCECAKESIEIVFQRAVFLYYRPPAEHVFDGGFSFKKHAVLAPYMCLPNVAQSAAGAAAGGARHLWGADRRLTPAEGSWSVAMAYPDPWERSLCGERARLTG